MIKVDGAAYVRFSAPDLDAMAAFLKDFGFSVSEQEDRLYASGAGPAPFLHVTTKGDPGFAGVAFRARSLDDLERLAAEEGASVKPLAEPGGGYGVRLRDPDGNSVEVVAGQDMAGEGARAALRPWNFPGVLSRSGRMSPLSPRPSRVFDIGHCVLNVRDFRASEAWYKSRLGFVTSDEIEAAPGFSIGAFLRCDRGEQPADHHSLFLLQAPQGPGFNHAAFEVEDFDDLMAGHDHLKRAGREPWWGVGRHILGSQVFDYWRDPWGHTLEHMTDGDRMTAADGSAKAGIDKLLGVQWGPPMTHTH